MNVVDFFVFRSVFFVMNVFLFLLGIMVFKDMSVYGISLC